MYANSLKRLKKQRSMTIFIFGNAAYFDMALSTFWQAKSLHFKVVCLTNFRNVTSSFKRQLDTPWLKPFAMSIAREAFSKRYEKYDVSLPWWTRL